MALTYVKNATAARIFFDGKGVEFHEKFQKSDGTEGVSKYTAWFDSAPGVSEGGIYNVSGLTGVKARIWTPDDGEARALADIVLNSARVEAVDAPVDEDTPF